LFDEYHSTPLKQKINKAYDYGAEMGRIMIEQLRLNKLSDDAAKAWLNDLGNKELWKAYEAAHEEARAFWEWTMTDAERAARAENQRIMDEALAKQKKLAAKKARRKATKTRQRRQAKRLLLKSAYRARAPRQARRSAVAAVQTDDGGGGDGDPDSGEPARPARRLHFVTYPVYFTQLNRLLSPLGEGALS
jgi:hypothetical protein